MCIRDRGNNIVVAKRNILEENFGLLETRRFELKYIDLDKAKETLNFLIPEGNRIVADKSSRAIIVKEMCIRDRSILLLVRRLVSSNFYDLISYSWAKGRESRDYPTVCLGYRTMGQNFQ